MKIKRFEEIEAWKRARELTRLVYEITSKGRFLKDWALRDQIRKACISVTSNIAEGFDSGFTREFIRFLCFSRRSLSEVQNQLYTALDQSYSTKNEFNIAYNQAEETRKIITGFIKYLKSYELAS